MILVCLSRLDLKAWLGYDLAIFLLEGNMGQRNNDDGALFWLLGTAIFFIALYFWGLMVTLKSKLFFGIKIVIILGLLVLIAIIIASALPFFRAHERRKKERIEHS